MCPDVSERCRKDCHDATLPVGRTRAERRGALIRGLRTLELPRGAEAAWAYGHRDHNSVGTICPYSESGLLRLDLNLRTSRYSPQNPNTSTPAASAYPNMLMALWLMSSSHPRCMRLHVRSSFETVML